MYLPTRRLFAEWNIYPDRRAAANGKLKLDEVTADINRRVTKGGKYIGIAAGYDFKHDYGKVGIRYSVFILVKSPLSYMRVGLIITMFFVLYFCEKKLLYIFFDTIIAFSSIYLEYK